MRLSDILILLAGLALCLFGALFAVGGLANAIEPPEGQSAAVFVLLTLFLGVVPFVGGMWMCVWSRRRSKMRLVESQERLILQLAQQRGGRLTVADVALNTALSSNQAQLLLEQYHLDGLSRVGVSDGGVVEYTFQGLVQEGTESVEDSPAGLAGDERG